jgi:hypothetical protein
LGKVDGEVPRGSIVDAEWDVLDVEGNVIGSAKSITDAKGAVEESAKVEVPVGLLQGTSYQARTKRSHSMRRTPNQKKRNNSSRTES